MADTPNYVADPTLWERAKRKVYGKSRSVDIYANTKIADEYERLGGRYRGSKPGKGRGIEKWFAERWVNLKDRKGGSFGPCGRKTAKPEDYATYLDFIDTYPKCVPLDKALAMTEAEREFAILNKDVALLRVKWLPGDPPASASTTPPKGSDIKAEVRRLREERKRLVAKVKREGVAWPPPRTASGPSTPEPQRIDWETYMRSRLPDPGLEHGALRATAQMSRRALRQHQARQREQFNVFFRDYDKVRAEYLQKIEARKIIDPSGSHYPSDETLDERIARLERMIEQMENAADFYEGEGLHDKARANRNVAARRRKAVERWKRERESQTPAAKEGGIRRAKGKRPKGRPRSTYGTVGFPKEVIEIKIPERDFLSMDPRSREYQENKAAQKRDLVDLAQALKNSAWTPGAERPSGVEVTTGKKSRSWIIAPLSTGEEGFRVGRWDPMGPSGHSDYKAPGYGRDQDPADSESVWRKIALEELFYSGEYGHEVDSEADVMIFRFLTPKRSLVDWWIQQPLGQWGMQVVQARGEGNRLRFEGKYEEAAEYEKQHMPPGPVPDPTPIPDTIGGAKVTQRRPGDGGHPVLSYTLTFAAEPYAKQRGVSKVARSPRGFMRAFEEAGSWENLSEWWKNRRNNFVARHMAQVEKRDEALWTKKGEPSRRHLALAMWAFTPDPKRFKKWLDEKLEERGRLLGGTGIDWIEGWKAVYDTGESLQDPSFYYPLTPGARVDAPTEDGLWFTTKFTVALEYAYQHGSKTLLKVRTARRAATPDPDTRGSYRTDFLEVVQVMDVGRTTGGPSSNLKALGTTVIDEGGVHFETGVPIRFRFIHNTDSSPFFGTEFQQHLEPGGFYLLHDETGTGPFVPGWQGGTAEVQSPIVLWHNTEQTIGYDEHSWKARLFDKFGSGSREPRGQKAARRQNEKLRQAILAAGYDAVVTVRRSDEPSTLEIVLLDPENQIVEVGDPVK